MATEATGVNSRFMVVNKKDRQVPLKDVCANYLYNFI